MVRAVFIGPCCLSVRGHAGQAERGRDIVCAGVSALVGALCAELTEIAPPELDITTAPGTAEIRCRPTEKARQAFRQTKLGLLLIMRDNAEYIDVT